MVAIKIEHIQVFDLIHWVAAQAVRWSGIPKVARSRLAQCSKSCDLQPHCSVQYVELRGYCPVLGGGRDQSIGSTVSDGIVHSWLWLTATRSSPLGYFVAHATWHTFSSLVFSYLHLIIILFLFFSYFIKYTLASFFQFVCICATESLPGIYKPPELSKKIHSSTSLHFDNTPLQDLSSSPGSLRATTCCPGRPIWEDPAPGGLREAPRTSLLLRD